MDCSLYYSRIGILHYNWLVELSLSLLHEPFPLSPVLIVRRVKFVHARFVQPVRHRDAEYRDDPQRSRGKSKGLFDDFARVAVKLHELVRFDRRRVTSASRHSSLSLSLWGVPRVVLLKQA